MIFTCGGRQICHRGGPCNGAQFTIVVDWLTSGADPIRDSTTKTHQHAPKRALRPLRRPDDPMPYWLASVAYEIPTTRRVADAGFQPVLFLCEQHVYRRGRYLPNSLAPIYPNYLFVYATGNLNQLSSVEGVLAMVRAEEGEVAEVRDDVVDDRRAVGRRHDDFCWVLGDVVRDSLFEVGDQVEVERWYEGQHRVAAVLGDGYLIVEMPLIGRMVQARVREADCRKIIDISEAPPRKQGRRFKRDRSLAVAA
jgi:hypothetical protein